MTDPSIPIRAAVDSDLEWDRLRRFLRADGAPMAIFEVDSAASAAQLVEAAEQYCGGDLVEKYEVTELQQGMRATSWLADAQAQAKAETIFLVLITETFAVDEPEARRFWQWANAQRERLRPQVGKLAFILTPRHVGFLYRWADALTEWIPLKFNLLGLGADGRSVQRDHEPIAQARSGRQSGQSAKLLPALRRQLVSARQRGLPESVVRRDYAWPLFRALVDAGHVREASSLKKTDLSGDFACELDPDERINWWLTLGILGLRTRRLQDASTAYENVADAAGEMDDEGVRAYAYHGFGVIAQERRDFDQAEQWYQKAVAIMKVHGNEVDLAITYHHLGMLAEDRRDSEQAEKWHRKALAIKEKMGDETSAASTYHHLGILAHERKDLEQAELRYRQSLKIKEKLGNEADAALTYGQLGNLCFELLDLDQAEQWYGKAMAVFEKLGIDENAGGTYHQLGRIALVHRDFDEADQWCRKAVAVFEKLDIKHHAANEYGQLGIVAHKRGDRIQAGNWYIKSVQTSKKCRDEHSAARNARNFARLLHDASDAEAAELRAMWDQAGLGELPDVETEGD